MSSSSIPPLASHILAVADAAEVAVSHWPHIAPTATAGDEDEVEVEVAIDPKISTVDPLTFQTMSFCQSAMMGIFKGMQLCAISRVEEDERHCSTTLMLILMLVRKPRQRKRTQYTPDLESCSSDGEKIVWCL